MQGWRKCYEVNGMMWMVRIWMEIALGEHGGSGDMQGFDKGKKW